MPRYIDTDELLARLADRDIFFPALYKNELNSTPTADVVLRKEYDAVVSAVDNSTKEFLKLHDAYQEEKREVERLYYNLQAVLEERAETKYEIAREIFEELETVLCRSVYPRANANGTITPIRSMDWHIWCDDYNAIKKKYTEGNDVH